VHKTKGSYTYLFAKKIEPKNKLEKMGKKKDLHGYTHCLDSQIVKLQSNTPALADSMP